MFLLCSVYSKWIHWLNGCGWCVLCCGVCFFFASPPSFSLVCVSVRVLTEPSRARSSSICFSLCVHRSYYTPPEAPRGTLYMPSIEKMLLQLCAAASLSPLVHTQVECVTLCPGRSSWKNKDGVASGRDSPPLLNNPPPRQQHQKKNQYIVVFLIRVHTWSNIRYRSLRGLTEKRIVGVFI